LPRRRLRRLKEQRRLREQHKISKQRGPSPWVRPRLVTERRAAPGRRPATGRDPAARPPATVAVPPRRRGSRRMARTLPAVPLTRRARSRRTGPAPGLRCRPRKPGRPPMARRAGCRRSRRLRCPGPSPARRGLRATRRRRGSRARRGLRPLRRTSGDRAAGQAAHRGLARLVPSPPVRPGQPRRVPARQAARDPVRVPRAPADRARRVPGRRVPAPRARVLRVPARGPVTTRSARPRPVWARRPPPGPKVRFPASRAGPAPGRATPRAPARPAARVPADAAPVAPVALAGPVAATAARVPVGSRVRVPAAPGRAR